jgi:hypothetical protein
VDEDWSDENNYLLYTTRSLCVKKSRYWTLFFVNWSRPTSLHTPIPVRYVLISRFLMRLYLRSGLFPWRFWTNILYAFPILSMTTTNFTHVILLNLIILRRGLLGKEGKLWSSSICNFLYRPIASVNLM